MPYICVWIHFIWAIKNREPLINKRLKEKMYSHIRENAKEKNIHLDFMNGTLDHLHLLVSLKATQSIAEIAQKLKGESSHWVNKSKLSPFHFGWQEEYIAVSISKSMVNRVREYIKNQEEHHRKKSFKEEYDEFLRIYGFSEYKKEA